jgi:hypothetical protein
MLKIHTFGRFAIFTSAKQARSLETAPGSCKSTRGVSMLCPWGVGFISDRVVSYLLEHGLKADGRLDPDAKDIGEPGSFETFFTETGNGKYVPRSIFVDLDPSVSASLCGDRTYRPELTLHSAH